MKYLNIGQWIFALQAFDNIPCNVKRHDLFSTGNNLMIVIHPLPRRLVRWYHWCKRVNSISMEIGGTQFFGRQKIKNRYYQSKCNGFSRYEYIWDNVSTRRSSSCVLDSQIHYHCWLIPSRNSPWWQIIMALWPLLFGNVMSIFTQGSFITVAVISDTEQKKHVSKHTCYIARSWNLGNSDSIKINIRGSR